MDKKTQPQEDKLIDQMITLGRNDEKQWPDIILKAQVGEPYAEELSSLFVKMSKPIKWVRFVHKDYRRVSDLSMSQCWFTLREHSSCFVLSLRSIFSNDEEHGLNPRKSLHCRYGTRNFTILLCGKDGKVRVHERRLIDRDEILEEIWADQDFHFSIGNRPPFVPFRWDLWEKS